MSENQIIMYFGTTHENSGHSITMLSGYLNINQQITIASELDSDEKLYSYICKGNGVKYIYYRGVTMLCIPYSLHDSRGGCKTMFIMHGKITQMEISEELKKYPWVYNVFNKLKKSHKLEGIIEIELT